MGQPVVHFEIIGKDPANLRSYFGELFGWEFDTSSPVAVAVSEPDNNRACIALVWLAIKPIIGGYVSIRSF